MQQQFGIIIPCYKHAHTLKQVLTNLAPFNYLMVVIDDGNDLEQKTIIKNTVKEFENAVLLEHATNLGKGAAIADGIAYLKEHHYTHAIQIDADMQHNLKDLNKFISLSKQYPKDIISGAPIFDEKAPKGRVIGRKITNFFVALECCTLSIKDAMIGFRVYPVEPIFKILKKHHVAMRMECDIEILVWAYWSDCKTRFIENKVNYPEGGISNFKAKDNLKISLMHTKLCTIAILKPILKVFNYV